MNVQQRCPFSDFRIFNQKTSERVQIIPLLLFLLLVYDDVLFVFDYLDGESVLASTTLTLGNFIAFTTQISFLYFIING